jgi:hypothetical protein
MSWTYSECIDHGLMKELARQFPGRTNWHKPCTFRRDSRWLDRDSNQAPTEHKYKPLPRHQWRRQRLRRPRGAEDPVGRAGGGENVWNTKICCGSFPTIFHSTDMRSGSNVIHNYKVGAGCDYWAAGDPLPVSTPVRYTNLFGRVSVTL